MNRRRLLLGATAALAAASVCGGVIVLQPTVVRAPRQPLLWLDDTTFSVLAALADRICPGGGGLPTAWELQVPESIDSFLDTIHPAARDEMLGLLRLLESGVFGLLFDGRPRVFTALGPAAQDRVLEAWRDSRLGPRRAGYKVLSGLVGGVYWGNRATWNHLGYPGPPRFGP